MSSADSVDVWPIENGVHLRKCLLNSQGWHILLQHFSCFSVFWDLTQHSTWLGSTKGLWSFSFLFSFYFEASEICEICVWALQHSTFVTHDKWCVLQAPVMVGMYGVVLEDEKPLGIELKDWIGKKNPNQTQHFHFVYGECCMGYSSFCTTLWLGIRVS